jgi:hypothetical protein
MILTLIPIMRLKQTGALNYDRCCNQEIYMLGTGCSLKNRKVDKKAVKE